MLKKERQAFILHQLNLHNRVLSSGLSVEINVSENTIRRDLQDTLQPIHIAGINKVHTLITELPSGDPLLKPYRDLGIEVL